MRSNDNKLDYKETRRTTQHEEVKRQLRDTVHQEIKRNSRIVEDEKAEIGTVAHDLKERAIREVSSTEQELARARALARVSQVIDYVFGLIYGLICLLIALELLGARESNGFKNFIDTVTYPLVAPFKGLLFDPSVGQFRLMLSYIVGLIVYALVHFALKGFLRLIAQRRTTI